MQLQQQFKIMVAIIYFPQFVCSEFWSELPNVVYIMIYDVTQSNVLY